MTLARVRGSKLVTVDQRFTQTAGSQVFAGNELLVKGCLETVGGTHLWTGYPGSPVSGFFDVAKDIKELLNEWGIRATVANNEALGAAMVNGSQMQGLRAICVQKSVGVHVAADALALGNLAGAHRDGGAVVVMGDDPWSDSTQVPADSRFIAKHLMMPVLEPSTPQELKDWIGLAFELSRASELYIGYLVTAHQADGGGTVEVQPNHRPTTNIHAPTTVDTAAIDLDRNVLLPPRTWRKEQEMGARVQRLWAASRRLGINQVWFDREHRCEWGIITSAAAYEYLRHALHELGVDGLIPILKLGLTYPLDPAVISDFCQGREHVVVVEERRSFLEEQVVSILSQLRQKAGPSALVIPMVWGKMFPHGLEGIPHSRGLNPSRLMERIGRLILAVPQLQASVNLDRIRSELAQMDRLLSAEVALPVRTPTFCPGCPHRDSSSLLLRIKKDFRDEAYMRQTHGAGPIDLVFHGDTGCYTMLMFEPNADLMHNYSGMGLGGGTGAGIDPFIRNKQVVFMGDSTFFHSGQIAISNSVKNRQDITYIILDNKTTAMTGHQPTASTEESITGEETFVQSIERIVSAMTSVTGGEAMVVRADPEDQGNYRRLLEKAVLAEGVKVVIADKECGITFHRRAARQERREAASTGFVRERRLINITPEVCENCLECTRATGCPGLSFESTPYGQKVVTDLSWCVSDGACTRFMVSAPGGRGEYKACPSFEEVVIRRTQAPVRWVDSLDFTKLPEPKAEVHQTLWHGYLAGVGGMGIGTAAAVLVLAAHRDGWRVRFCDKKGLAIRNGGVFSMITLSRGEAPVVSNLIPYGKADLLLGMDILEATRALDPAGGHCVGNTDRTAVVVNRHRTPTIRGLLGKDELDVDACESVLRQGTRSDRFLALDVSAFCERAFGSKLYANMVLVGVAFQRGFLPLRLEALIWALENGLGSGVRAENLRAFHAGRWLAENPERAEARQQEHWEDPVRFEAVLEDKRQILASESGASLARLAPFFERYARESATALGGNDSLKADFVRRIYDTVVYGGEACAKAYVDRVLAVRGCDPDGSGDLLTQAAVWNLHRALVIKDEIYVAHLLTSFEKRRRDQSRFNIDPVRGDRLEYRHFNRPEVVLGGRRFAMDLVTRDWMLKIVRRLGWMRSWLPAWHAEERKFRDWYLEAVDEMVRLGVVRGRYEDWVALLRLPADVSGYREVRYPKIEAAMQRGNVLRASLRAGEKPQVPHPV